MRFSKFLKFGIFVWTWWIGTIIVSISVSFLVEHYLGFNAAMIALTILLTYGIINSVSCTIAFKKNLKMYHRIHDSFLAHEDNIKKSILYQMQHYCCTSIMAKDLAHEFKIQL